MSIASVSNIDLIRVVNPKTGLINRKYLKYDVEHVNGSVVRCTRIWEVYAKPTERVGTNPGRKTQLTGPCPEAIVNKAKNWIVEQEITHGHRVSTAKVAGTVLTVTQKPPRQLTEMERTLNQHAAERLQSNLWKRRFIRLEKQQAAERLKHTQLQKQFLQLKKQVETTPTYHYTCSHNSFNNSDDHRGSGGDHGHSNG